MSGIAHIATVRNRGLRRSLMRAMPAHARLVPRACNTADRRVIRWWECELVSDAGVVRRLRDHGFFSAAQARDWAAAAGYPVLEPQPDAEA